jgi:hypothetical protein
VVRHEIEKHPDAAVAGATDQLVEIAERAQIGIDPLVVGHVVAPVRVRGRHRRIQPDAFDTQPCEMV